MNTSKESLLASFSQHIHFCRKLCIQIEYYLSFSDVRTRKAVLARHEGGRQTATLELPLRIRWPIWTRQASFSHLDLIWHNHNHWIRIVRVRQVPCHRNATHQNAGTWADKKRETREGGCSDIDTSQHVDSCTVYCYLIVRMWCMLR